MDPSLRYSQWNLLSKENPQWNSLLYPQKELCWPPTAIFQSHPPPNSKWKEKAWNRLKSSRALESAKTRQRWVMNVVLTLIKHENVGWVSRRMMGYGAQIAVSQSHNLCLYVFHMPFGVLKWAKPPNTCSPNCSLKHQQLYSLHIIPKALNS